MAKELIALPADDDRGSIRACHREWVLPWRFLANRPLGLLGYGFIYTNKESLSIGTGALLRGSDRDGAATSTTCSIASKPIPRSPR